jgi:NitT/TauT family transport system substrate-binding protein
MRQQEVNSMSVVRKLILASLISLLARGAAFAEDKVLFQYSWIPSGEYAPISAGIQKGFFKEAGIDLSITSGRGSGDAVNKVAAGVAPFGDADISAVMTARQRNNAPVKCLMALHTTSPHALFVLDNSSIKSIKDVAGKNLATSAGNSHYLYFPLVAKMNGVDPSSVNWTTVDAGALAPMLIAGKVDGATLFAINWYYQNKMAEKQGKKIRVIPFADYGFKIYAYCIHGNEDFVKANPDLTRRFLAALRKSYMWAQEHVEEAAQLHKKMNPETDVDDTIGTLTMQFQYMFNEQTKRDGLGYFNPGQLQETYKVVAEAQHLPAGVDATQFVDTSYLPKE